MQNLVGCLSATATATYASAVSYVENEVTHDGNADCAPIENPSTKRGAQRSKIHLSDMFHQLTISLACTDGVCAHPLYGSKGTATTDL